MARVETRTRELKWWQEAGEEQYMDGHKLEEAYDPKRLKPGYDGRNGPDVKTLYAKKGESRFDKLGADGGDNQEVSKPKKGAQDTADLSVKEKRMREFEDEQGMDNLESDGGMDDDVPPEMEEPMDDEFGDEEGMEGGDEVADEVTVEIQGQRFKLVPEEPEEGMGDEFGDEGMEDEGFGDEGGQGLNTEPPPTGEMEPEDDDVEFPHNESAPKARKRVKESASSKKEAAEYVKKLLKMKAFAEAELNELFTGDYVVTKGESGGLAGMDFKPVTGDTKFAVIARAASGDQYTVNGSSSPYEPGSESKGQTGKGKVCKTAAPTVESFKSWLQKTYLNEIASEDENKLHAGSGSASQQFNKEDLFGQITPASPLEPKEYPQQPELVGMGNPTKQGKQDNDPTSDTTVLTMAKTARAGESTANTKARLEAVKKARIARRQQESAVVKPDGKVDLLNEELDWKKLMNGEY